MKIVCVGEITIDHYPDLNQSFVGGISLNFAVNAKRCGADSVSLVSSVGTDEGGRKVLAKLAKEGIDASHVAILPGETARIDIQVAAHGERAFPAGRFRRNVLNDLRLTENDLIFIQQHDILAFLYDHSQPDSPVNRAAAELDFDGKRVADFGDWTDYGGDYAPLLSSLESLDLAFVSGNQATVDYLLPFSRHLKGLIVITLGADGSAALMDGMPFFQPAQPIANPVDSTGCGDAFQAAFTVAYFRTASVKQALHRGTVQAATVIQHYGATN
jgi:fructoselysine 6-kinase